MSSKDTIATPCESESGAGQAPQPERKPRLLLVDDEPINVETLAAALGDEYVLSFALDGVQALQLAAAEPQPDLLLLDIVMPGMDGFEVFARLRTDRRTAKIPVIFLTALNDSLNERRGLQMGAVDYIHKPLQADIVRARVDMHIRLRFERS